MTEATMAKRSKKLLNESAVDRLSDLPDAVIHHIFSFLPRNYMFFLTMVSKRFSQLCLSTPYLYFKFPDEDWSSRRQNFCNRSEFCRLVDKFLPHDSINNHRMIQSCSFRLNLDFSAEEDTCISSWLSRASKCNVREINIALHGDFDSGKHAIPGSVTSVFTFQSLRALSLQSYFSSWEANHIYQKVDLPCVVLGSLKSLTLKSIAFNGHISLGEWISTCVPFLRKLELDSVVDLSQQDSEPRVFEITHHVLQALSITRNFRCSRKWFTTLSIFCDSLLEMSLNWNNQTDNHETIVRLSVPKLHFLDLAGHHAPRIDLLDINSLRYASLNFSKLSGKQSYDSLVQILKIASSTDVLQTTPSLIKVLLRQKCAPVAFENIKHVEISKDCIDFEVLSNFISRVPNLVTLTMEERRQNVNIRRALGDGDILSPYTEAQVNPRQGKEVKIRLSDCRSNDLELVKYFLDNMDSMEKLTILYSGRPKHPTYNKISKFLSRHRVVVSGKVAISFNVMESLGNFW